MPTTPRNLRPHQKRWTPHWLNYFTLQQEEGRFPLLTPHNSSASERLSQFSQWETRICGTPSLCQRNFAQNSPPNSGLSSRKECFSPLLPGLAKGFSIAYLSQIAILCSSQVNLFLLVNYNYFTVKVNKGLINMPSCFQNSNVYTRIYAYTSYLLIIGQRKLWMFNIMYLIANNYTTSLQQYSSEEDGKECLKCFKVRSQSVTCTRSGGFSVGEWVES